MANTPSQRLADWFAGAQGSRLLLEERPLLGEVARRFHGDTLLWVGCHDGIAGTVRGCMIRHHLFASELAGPDPEELSSLRCVLDSLPLPNNSLDAMVLHHALEVSGDPRGGLREAARVLAPGGRLVICSFNPLSVWGARRALARIRDDAFTGMRLVTSFRLLDWLALLGFERQAAVQYLSYNLPFSAGRRTADAQPGRLERGLRRIQAPLGGVYLISAVKQAAALRPHWRATGVKGTKLVPATYPKSAVSRTPARVLQFSDWKDLERGG